MEHSFWQSRWDQNEIGFHLGRPHGALAENLERFRDRRDVLVPLAGKTVDVDALASVAGRVTANEFVERAAHAWFEERSLSAQRAQHGTALQLEHDNVRYLVGDFFGLEVAEGFDAAFDRAALVAIEPSRRQEYARALAKLLRPGAVLLLVVFEYDQSLFPGPPFSVPANEVQELFADSFHIEPSGTTVEPVGERMQKAGIHELREQSYWLTRKG